ncbi:hypothetical protein MLD38_009907 [Melastoma candidum]|nr:hypothetical protein MLD38_009907 [Melastoma candidum]
MIPGSPSNNTVSFEYQGPYVPGGGHLPHQDIGHSQGMTMGMGMEGQWSTASTLSSLLLSGLGNLDETCAWDSALDASQPPCDELMRVHNPEVEIVNEAATATTAAESCYGKNGGQDLRNEEGGNFDFDYGEEATMGGGPCGLSTNYHLSPMDQLAWNC